jgi:c-di-GMP phosphodiesterase
VVAQSAVVGRQGIFGPDGLVGYELLFRPVRPSAVRPPGDEMTATVVFGAISIGLDQLVGDHTAFLNADRGVVTGEMPVLLPPERTVIEILETLDVDDEIVAGVERLRAAGYRIALDDFVWGSGHERLLPQASIVKIDLSETPRETLAEVVDRCREHDVQLLAERVTDLADVPWLTEIGFELFQGFAFERPDIVFGRTLDADSVSRLTSVSQVLAVAGDFDGVEEILRRDPALMHHVMQLASLGRMGGTRRSISTLRDALVAAGSRGLRNWMALLLARPRNAGPTSTQATQLAIQRARACEVLADALPEAERQIGFVAGLLSALDLLFEAPRIEILSTMHLSDELYAAASGEGSPLARLVADAEAYQLGTGVPGARSGLPLEAFDDAFAEAFRWAHADESVAVATREPLPASA